MKNAVLVMHYDKFDAESRKMSSAQHGRMIEENKETRSALLQYQNFDFLFYLGWSGSFLQFRQNIRGVAKGQIISECPYEIIVCPKIATKKFPRFLPWPLRRGQIKNFIKPIMLNSP